MSRPPKIKVAIQPDPAEMAALEQRLEAAGLPADGTPDGMADTAITFPLLTPANVQTGVGVLKDQLPHQPDADASLPQTQERDPKNQRDSEAGSLPQ